MTFFEFVSTWLLGILTFSLTNDNTAIAQCREDLIELEKELESLRDDSTRIQNTHFKKIINIKQILKKLNIHYAGLFIRHYGLQTLIEKSFEDIYRMESNPYEPQNKSNIVSIELTDLWGSIPNGKYQATKIKELQKSFFCKGFLGRTLYFIENNPFINFIKNNPIKIISLVIILILIGLYKLYINVIEYSPLNLIINLNF